MATLVPPKKNTALTIEVPLQSWDETRHFASGGSIAAGDVQVSKDGGSYSNVSSLPTEIGTSGIFSLALTADEMNADRVAVHFHSSGSAWSDALVTIHTVTANQIDDLFTDSAADLNKLADHVIRRSFQNACDSSDGDTKTGRSILGAVAKLVNKVEASGGSLIVYEDDDSTMLYWQAITTDSGADPITELDTN